MSAHRINATRDSKLWVEHTPEREARARKVFQIKMYDDKSCDKCEYRPERHCEVCNECPSFLGEYKLYKKKDIGSKILLGMPVGRVSLIKKVIGSETKLRIKDRRAVPLFKNKIKFTGTLQDAQKQPVADMVVKKRGILLAPPRAGKTVMGIAIACEVGYKTLIITNQYDYLQQFLETIKGNKKEPAMTNVPDIEERKNKQIAGFCKKVEDMAKYDICLCTYQSFISEGGKKRLQKIKNMFGTVILDECFTYGHRVQTENGLMRIGDIVENKFEGLKVLSFNHATGNKEFKPVESVTKKKTRKLIKVTIEGKEFLCTPNHEFWSETRKQYVEAKDIKAGEQLILK
jgi:hypothetical protein